MGKERYEAAKAALEAGSPLRPYGDRRYPSREAIVYFVAGADVITGETLILDGGNHLNTGAVGPALARAAQRP